MQTHHKSQTLFAEAQRLMPGGVNSPARAFRAVGGVPIVMARGQGASLFDVDGNRYLDYVGSWGALILGHAHPAVVEAVRTAAADGTSFGAPTQSENELARLIIDAVPSVEKVRLVNSGSEATMSAIRLARGFTGRHRIVKFAGNYHGHVDSLLVSAGSSAATLAQPDSAGITPGTSRDTLVLEYNDASALEATFAQMGDEIAAVIVEPVAGNMGCVLPTSQFLAALRALTRAHGALLILDEVITGFRVAWGGAQERFGIDPDLTTLGKIMGGGLPCGAFGGRAHIMNHVVPEGRVFQAGTLSGNPVATAAGIATLKQLKETPPYERLERLASKLEAGLAEAACSAGLPFVIGRCGSMLTFFFHDRPVDNWQTAGTCDTRRYARFFWGMLEQGVYLPCSQFEAMFVSQVHTEADVARTVEAAQRVFAILD
jgi:glutamate-1-semialdehyde 2,1-aminomutase